MTDANFVKPSFWKAKYDFNGVEEENQFSFKAGDTFVVIQHHEGGWFTAQRNGETGYIPSNYLEEIERSPALPKALPAPPQRKLRSNTQLSTQSSEKPQIDALKNQAASMMDLAHLPNNQKAQRGHTRGPTSPKSRGNPPIRARNARATPSSARGGIPPRPPRSDTIDSLKRLDLAPVKHLPRHASDSHFERSSDYNNDPETHNSVKELPPSSLYPSPPPRSPRNITPPIHEPPEDSNSEFQSESELLESISTDEEELNLRNPVTIPLESSSESIPDMQLQSSAEISILQQTSSPTSKESAPSLPSVAPILFKPPSPENYPSIPPRTDKTELPPPSDVSSLKGSSNQNRLDAIASPSKSSPRVETIAPSTDQIELLTAGHTFSSYNKRGKPYQRWVCVSNDLDKIIWREGNSDKKKPDNLVFIGDIIALKKGYAILGKKKNIKPPGNPALALSIIIREQDETKLFDLESSSTALRDLWFDALERVIKIRAARLQYPEAR